MWYGGWVSIPCFRKVKDMDNKEFNERRHNRDKQKYRFILGIQQFLNYPIINILWVLFAGGVLLMVIAEKKIVANMEVYPLSKD